MFLLDFGLIFYQTMPRGVYLCFFFKCAVMYMHCINAQVESRVWTNQHTQHCQTTHSHTKICKCTLLTCMHKYSCLFSTNAHSSMRKCSCQRACVHVCGSHKQCVPSHHFHWDSCHQAPQHTSRQACLARRRVRNRASCMSNISWKTTPIALLGHIYVWPLEISTSINMPALKHISTHLDKHV